ncbi:inositol monophosphatase [Klebsiella quasipneumoniae]|nr:inositol monophosphatase [Klebsiella quasipneumoniae]VAO25930.1 inositol monophosphatase [Klebsiella quasipneumoniae]
MLALLSSSGSVVTSGAPTKKVPVNSSSDSRKTKMLAATIPGVDYVCSDNAAGQLHAYYEAHMNSWDALAGMLLIEEAGGTCNAFLANEGLRRDNRVLAGCAGVQPRLAALLEK